MSKPAANGKRRGRQPGPSGPTLRGGSKQARQRTAVILEVLAGYRTPAEAAEAVGVSVTRYYALEAHALQGLLAACEPRAPGRQRSVERELAAAQAEVKRLEREYARSQALLRLSQRAVGVKERPVRRGKTPSGKRRRRPMQRALKAAEKLRAEAEVLSTEGVDAKTE